MRKKALSELQDKVDYLARQCNSHFVNLQKLRAELDELTSKLEQLYTFNVTLLNAISDSIIAADDARNLQKSLLTEFEKLNSPEEHL